MVDIFPPLKSIPYRFNYGTFSWKIPELGVRYLKKSNAVHIKDNWYEPPTQFTRRYLDWKFPKRLRASKHQAIEITKWIAPPLYCKPGIYKDMVYIDVKSAYWSIVKRYGWNADYFPEKWLLVGCDCTDFPLPDNKIARNCLLSFTLPTQGRVWNGHSFDLFKSKNIHINMGLWRLTQDILHAIASLSLDCRGIYVHTDGCIIPSSHEHYLGNFIRSFGLDYTVKARGDAILTGFGSYIIGERQTKSMHFDYDKPFSRIIRQSDKYIETITNCKGIPHRRGLDTSFYLD